MLNDAVKEARGEKTRDEYEAVIDLTVSAFIPASYIPDEGQKLELYRRIASLENQEEAEDMTDELIDRFGEPPVSVRNLIAAAVIKAQAHKCYVTEIRQTGTEIRIGLYERAMIDAQKIPALLDRDQYRRRLQFHVGEKPYFSYDMSRQDHGAESVLRNMQTLMDDMEAICFTA